MRKEIFCVHLSPTFLHNLRHFFKRLFVLQIIASKVPSETKDCFLDLKNIKTKSSILPGQEIPAGKFTTQRSYEGNDSSKTNSVSQ